MTYGHNNFSVRQARPLLLRLDPKAGAGLESQVGKIRSSSAELSGQFN